MVRQGSAIGVTPGSHLGHTFVLRTRRAIEVHTFVRSNTDDRGAELPSTSRSRRIGRPTSSERKMPLLGVASAGAG
jgi:hypothetical protein